MRSGFFRSRRARLLRWRTEVLHHHVVRPLLSLREPLRRLTQPGELILASWECAIREFGDVDLELRGIAAFWIARQNSTSASLPRRLNSVSCFGVSEAATLPSAPRSAAANSCAFENRSSGFFASALLTIESNSGETLGTIVEGGGGSVFKIAFTTVQAPPPLNGFSPESNWYRMSSEKISLRGRSSTGNLRRLKAGGRPSYPPWCAGVVLDRATRVGSLPCVRIRITLAGFTFGDDSLFGQVERSSNSPYSYRLDGIELSFASNKARSRPR